ncbi:T9SS type A sorting domain-containing protein [bacterium]|nr:T9SS type A sorting domain-containing protein [bacterium]
MAAVHHLTDIFRSMLRPGSRFISFLQRITLAFSLALMIPLVTFADVLVESGSLRGFIAGDEPAAEYDNWLSHVSEGIDNPGYNDYGPDWLDPQNSGFGAYRIVPDSPAGDRLLDHWRRIFDSFLLGHEVNVGVLLQDSAETFFYDIVRFTDTDRDRDVLILREELDSSFVDENTPGTADDVIGSFRNGWGLYVVDLEAPRPWLMIQMTHPCDDFIGVQAAIDLFFRLGAGAISINGAGREVVVRDGGGSTNSRSLSDPSRNGRAPFQTFHEAFVDRFKDDYPHSALVAQMHSFDRSNNHDTPVIISEGAGWPSPLLPYRDRQSDGFNSIIQQTPEPPVQAGTYEGLGPLEIDPFYGVNHIGGLTVVMPGGSIFDIERPPSHLGDPHNVQAIHIHDVPTYTPDQAVAPFLHVELDEWPHYLDEGGFELLDLVNDPRGVPTWEDYLPWLEFYDPFFAGLEAWLEWFTTPQEPLETSSPSISQLTMGDNGEVHLEVSEEGFDYYRAWIEVVSDTADLTDDSPVVLTGIEDNRLKRVQFDDIIEVSSPFQGREVHFAVRSVELDGTRGPLSNTMSAIPNDTEGIVPDHQPFDLYPVSAWPAWIGCIVEDDEQLTDIKVVYQVNSFDPDTLEMALISPWSHAYGVQLPEEGIGQSDWVSYKIITHDNSPSGNPVVLPGVEEWYAFQILNSPTMIRTWDFEVYPEEMEFLGGWEHGQPESDPPGLAHSGSNVVGTNLDGTYPSGFGTTLTLPNVGRMEYGPLILSFHQFIDYPVAEEPGVALQGGLVWWVGDGLQGPVFLPVYDYRLQPMEGVSYDVFSGTSAQWEEVVMDLTTYYGRMRDLEFYQPDGADSPEHMGWYIDDLIITRSINTQPPLPVTLLAPEDADTVRTEPRTFSWAPTVDPDPRTQVEYIFRLTGDAGQFDSTGILDTTLTLDVRSFDWVGLGEHLLHWQVDAVSQGDTVANAGGPRSLVLPSLGVDEETNLPRSFSLGAGYPNPFNAAVTIPYELPRASSVRLEVYNLLGQRVALLENQRRTAGTYKTVWDAHHQASGLYFITFEAGSFHATRKVLLIK